MTTSVTRQRVANASLLEYARTNRDDGFFSDITIVAGKESIPANRLVLSCYSKYFETMFKSQMRERYENTIEIQTVNGKEMRALINFIYVGSIKINHTNVMDLLSGADYFQLDEVKQFCFEFLQTNITPDNSLAILKAATLYRNENLEDQVQMYISNNLDEVAKTEDFQALSEQDLILCISNLEQSQAVATSIYKAIVVWTYYSEKTRKKFLFTADVWRLNLQNRDLNWEKISSMNEMRHVMGAAIHCHNTIVAAGGSNEISEALESVECYIAALNEWKTISPMIQPRWGNALVSCNGCLYALGRCDKNQFMSSVERIGDLKETWENVQPMQEPRSWLAAVNCEGTLYAIGGQAGKETSTISKTVEKYDGTTNKWAYAQDMNFKRSAHAACVLRGKIYVVGGIGPDKKAVKEIECFDPANNKWSIVETVNDEIYHHALVAE